MSVTVLPSWKTIPEAARATGLSEWTLRQQIKRGNLAARRVGRCVRVLDSELARWMCAENDNGPAAAGHVVSTSPSPSEYVNDDVT